MSEREAVSLDGFCMVRAVKPDVEVRRLYKKVAGSGYVRGAAQK